MPRAERHSQDNNEKKPNNGLFQRLGKNKPETRQEQPKPHKKLSDIFKKANTPREKEAAAQHGEIKKETRGLLGNLRENIGIEKRQQIRELQKTVSKNPDISKDKEAVRAYQELIKLTDPERFAREIGTVDGVYGNKTRKAYEVDKKAVDNPRSSILTALSSNTQKETPETRIKRTNGSGGLRNLFNFHNIGAEGSLGAGKFQSLPAERVTKPDGSVMTYCSRTARKNLGRLGLDVPSPSSAINTLSEYRSGNFDISGLSTGGFNATPGAKVADIVMSTGRAHGHRSMAYKQGNSWYVNDPYITNSTASIPLSKYESNLKARGWRIEGAAFYDRGNIA